MTRGYEGRIVWPRPVLTLPSSSSAAKLPGQASVLSAMSAADISSDDESATQVAKPQVAAEPQDSRRAAST